MTGIENITGRFQADAQAEIDRIDADARAQADKITAAYAARAERECADILERGAKSAAERGDRLVSAAQMEARQMNLAAKQEVLDKAFALALSKLLAMPEADYAALLARLAVSAARTGREEIILNPADQEKLGEQVAAEANALLVKDGRTGALTVSKQTQPLKGGLLLSDGAVEVNCALETLVRLSRTDVTGEVSKLLFA